MKGLRAGDEIKVRDDSGGQYAGVFASVTPASILLTTRTGEAAIERVRVRRVEVRSASRRAVHAAIGAGIGLALGAAVDQTFGTLRRNETGEGSARRSLTYLAPMGVCAGIGAVFPAYRTVYRVR